MKIAPEIARLIEDYLHAVEDRLAGKHPDVRRELLAELRSHIEEALHRRGGETPSLADAETVLGEMDPPESFSAEASSLANDALVTPGGEPARPARGTRWFLLAVAFLLVNGYGVLKMRGPAASASGPAPHVVRFEPGDNALVEKRNPLHWTFSADVRAPSNQPPARLVPEVRGRFTWPTARDLEFEPDTNWPACQTIAVSLEPTLQGAGGPVDGVTHHTLLTPPLALERIEVLNLTRERAATLRLHFNGAPDFESLPDRLKLLTASDDGIAYEFQARDPRDTVVTIETESGAPDVLHLALKTPLPPMNGTRGLEKDLRVKVALPKELALQRLDPFSPAFEPCGVNCFFTEGLEPSGLKDFIRIEPAVKFTAEPLGRWEGAGLRLTGDFKPGAIYTVTFKAGLKSVNDRTLRAEVSRVVQIDDRPRQVSFTPPGRILSPRGSLTIPLSAMNVEKVQIALEPVLPRNLPQLALRDAGRLESFYGNATDQLTGRWRTITNTIAAKPNQAVTVPVRLRELLDGDPVGAYVLHASTEDASDQRRLILVSDLGLSLKQGANGLLAWVTSLRDAQPAAGVEVTLIAANQGDVAKGTTGPDGTVFLPVTENDDAPVLAIARRGNDQTYIDLAKQRVTIRDAAIAAGGARVYAENLEAYVFTDRGVYRPDETVHLRALVRDHAMKAPAPFPALFRIRRPDGRVFKDLPVTLDANGAAGADVALPEFLPTGRYSLELAMPGTFTVLGEGSVALEDFVPPQIRVNVTTPKPRLAGGETARFTIAAEHLFGRPAAGLKATGAYTIRLGEFKPAAWRGWSFGDRERRFSPRFVRVNPTELDEEGKSSFSIATSDAWRPPAAVEVVFEAGVVETSGRTVTQYGSTPVDVYPFYIGLRRDADGSVLAGSTQRVQTVAVLPDGRPVSTGLTLNVTIARESWNSVLRRSENERYSYVSERELTTIREDIIAVSGAPSDFVFALPSAGDYVLTFTEPGSEASSSLHLSAYSAGQTWASWSRENPDTLEIAADKPAYHPGETARLTVKAPFAGTALLTIESDRILTQRVVVLEKNTADLAVELTDAYAPCVHASLTMIRPAIAETVWSAHRATGSALLRVQPAGRALKVALDAPKTQRPQAALPVALTLTQEDGSPAARADVVVMAVDEAILGLTNFETPDPLAWWLAPRLRGVELSDLFADLMPEYDEHAGGTSAAGGDGEAALRRRLSPIRSRRFKPVALWAGVVQADAAGRATVNLDVPEFSGELRVMAVAYNATQAGHADAAVKVKRALVVQPSLPRFLAPGDTGELSIELFNESGQPADLQLRVACGGPLSSATATSATNLAAGAHALVRIPLKAGDVPGAALCTVEVDGAGERYRESIELPVRPAATAQAVAQYGILKPGEKARIEAPTNLVGASVVQDVWTSGRPDVNLARPLDYLLHYPYGCLEQTVSASLPLLYVSDIAARRLPGSMQQTDVADYVRQGIGRVLSMQQEDGSFSMWPQDRGTWIWGSVYAAHFLVEAKRASYTVPPDRLDDALTWLRRRLDTPTGSDPTSSAWKEDLELRAYAAHVLALAGKPQHGWNARLREVQQQLTYAARVHAACALMLAGEPRAATELLAAAGDPAFDAPRETGGFLRSGTADASLLLGAWVDLDPARPEVARLAKRLVGLQRDGHWMTTHDNALAVLALGKYAHSLRGAIQPFAGTIRLPGGLTRDTSTSNEVHWTSARGESGAVEIENRGPGELHYVVRHDGIPLAGAVTEDDSGLRVRRQWLDASGEPLTNNVVAQGDLVIVKLSLETGRDLIDNVAIEDLLPAGLEIENPNLVGTARPAWMGEVDTSGFRRRDIRDDRLLLFTGPVSGAHLYYYAARAVTPGRYTVPAAVAEAMYDPGLRSVNGRATLEVTP